MDGVGCEERAGEERLEHPVGVVGDEGGEDVGDGGLCASSDEGVGVGEERHEEALEDGEVVDVGEVEDARGGEERAEVEAGE